MKKSISLLVLLSAFTLIGCKNSKKSDSGNPKDDGGNVKSGDVINEVTFVCEEGATKDTQNMNAERIATRAVWAKETNKPTVASTTDYSGTYIGYDLYNNGLLLNVLKLGSSKQAGEINFTFSVKVATVKIYGANWSKDTTGLKVNEQACTFTTAVDGTTPADYKFETSTDITLESASENVSITNAAAKSSRAVISKITFIA